MKKTHYIFGITAIALLMLLSSGACATTITVQGGTITPVGSQQEFGVTGDSFPDGLLGYELDVALTDPAKAEIVSFEFPGWVNVLSSNSTIPTDSLHLKAVGNFAVPPGSTDVPLITVTVRGDQAGLTDLTVTNVLRLEDYNGTDIPYTIVPGTINVGAVPTTIPTTTATTTATTTIPTTTATTTATTTIPTTTATTTATTTIPTTTVTTTATTTIPTTTVTTTATTTIPTTTATTTATTTIPTTVITTPLPPGTMTIVTLPGGATVALDGNVIGVTPLVGKTVPAGMYTLSISLTGYKTYIQPVTVIPGEETAVDNYIVLQQGVGTVTPFPTAITPTTVITTPITTGTTTSTTVMTTTPTPSPSVSPSPSPTDGNSSFKSSLLEYWKNITQNTSNTFSQLIQKFL